jgi:hypothetical protein
VNKEGIPVCPECGGPMHLESSAYGRAWECDRRQGVGPWCAGVIRIEDDDSLSDLQIAETLARRAWGGSADSAKAQAKYRRLSGPLRDLAESPYLSRVEKRVLADAAAIVQRLAEAAELAKDQAKRQEKAKEAAREARYRQALGLLGRSFTPDPTRIEASVIDLLTLDRYSDDGRFGDYTTIETFDAALRRRAGSDPTPLDRLLRELAMAHQDLRDTIARSWSWRTEPIQDLHARLTAELAVLREAILAAPPVFLQGVWRLLAESEAPNVVRLPIRRPS